MDVGMSDLHTVKLEVDDDKVSVNLLVGLANDTNKSKKRGRDFSAVDKDECYIRELEKASKRIILSLTRPSYLLGLGSNIVRPENRVRLCQLLQKLVRQHNWTEASGILSILLKGTCKDNNPIINRLKYSVSMECLKHMEFDNSNLTSFSSMYSTWVTRISNLSNKQKRNGSMKEDCFAVHLESILFGYMKGNIEDERENAKSLMQYESKGNAVFNLIIGLIFYQLFFSRIPEDMQWKDTISADSSQSDMSMTGSIHEFGGSESHNSHFTDEAESSVWSVSETSVMKDKEMPAKAYDGFHKAGDLMEVDDNQQTNLPEATQLQGFYVNSIENSVSVDNNGGHLPSSLRFFAPKSLDPWLLPLQTGDWEMGVTQYADYKNAVRYLQEAARSSFPSLAALLPLIQLLLIGFQYEEAMNELEKFCDMSNAALPSRMRAHLSEHIDPNNKILIATSYENTLKSDPTCSVSLARLISLHQDGNYGPESLLEMIALHLDAVFPENGIWREFSLCFIKVLALEEDCESMCLNRGGGEKLKGYSVRYNRIPKFLIHGNSGKGWKLRCRWWSTRHFSNNQLASEIASGNLELLSYKAACASHIYGQQFDYVRKAYNCLDEENNRDLYKFLQFHIKNSVGFYSCFQQRTN